MSYPEKMSLQECEDLAKNVGFDSSSFDLVGPGGRMKAKWLDAYFGFFTVEGQQGFMRVKDAAGYGLWAENFAGPATTPQPKKPRKATSAGGAQRTTKTKTKD